MAKFATLIILLIVLGVILSKNEALECIDKAEYEDAQK